MTLKEKVLACVAENTPSKYRGMLIKKIKEIFLSVERYRVNEDEVIKLHSKKEETHRILTEKDSAIGDAALTKHNAKKYDKN